MTESEGASAGQLRQVEQHSKRKRGRFEAEKKESTQEPNSDSVSKCDSDSAGDYDNTASMLSENEAVPMSATGASTDGEILQGAPQGLVKGAKATVADEPQLHAITKESSKHSGETLQQEAMLPCLLCGGKDCLLCDWCGEACSGQGHQRSECTGASTYQKGDTCLRCYKPKASKGKHACFKPPTQKNRHRLSECPTCPKEVKIELRLVKSGHLVLWRSDEDGSVVRRPWHHNQKYTNKGCWDSTAVKNKHRNLNKKSEQQLHGAITKKSQKRGKAKGKGSSKYKVKGKGSGRKGGPHKPLAWTCKHCQTVNICRGICFNRDCKRLYAHTQGLRSMTDSSSLSIMLRRPCVFAYSLLQSLLKQMPL